MFSDVSRCEHLGVIEPLSNPFVSVLPRNPDPVTHVVRTGIFGIALGAFPIVVSVYGF